MGSSWNKCLSKVKLKGCLRSALLKALVRKKKKTFSPYDTWHIMMILEISTKYQRTKRKKKSWTLKKWNANQNWCFIFQNALPFAKEKIHLMMCLLNTIGWRDQKVTHKNILISPFPLYFFETWDVYVNGC
jgi:hypothetical protein